MKKTRRALSIVLSLLIVFTSMPMMHIVSTAAGTLGDPTTAVKESNPYEYEDLFKLNIKHSNNNFFFYQTVDDEYFVVKQDLLLQQYTVPLGENRTLIFHGIDFYAGGSNVADATDAAGVVEEPTITTNPTSEFITNHLVSDVWASTNSNSEGLDCRGDVSLQASGYDLNGRHKEYTWTHSIVFRGHSAETSGQINTGYYERATWDWDDGEGNTASMDFRIKTSITVVDAREFAEALANAENVLANPGNYSAAYVSAIKATLDDIPADLKDFSGYYSQSIVNSFTELIVSIPEDVADYREFNRVLAECRAFTNDGTYSARSYAAYVAEVESINSGLPKNLYASQQATVDSAVQALKNAKELLVIEFPSTGSTTNSDIEDLSPWVENEFNFIQIEDDQVLAFTQSWTMYRGTNSSNRMFYITLDTTDANTASFAPRFTTDCVTTVPTLTSGAIEGTLSNQTIFTNWSEYDANGNPKDDVEAIVDGVIDPGYGGFQNGTTYYFKNGLSFVGMSANESGPKTFTYNQKIYVNWTQWIVVTINHYNSTTYTTTLNITDARALVDEYNKALNVLENPGLHSAAYITELQKIVDSVPQDMVNGTKYYTQAEVDAYYEQFTVLSESLADYSAFDAAYDRIEAILANPDAYSGATLEAAQNVKAQADAFNKGLIDSVSNRQAIADMAATLNSVADNAEARADYSTYNSYIDIAHSVKPTDYTGDAYAEFMEVVESVQASLPLDLGTSQQAQVDEACNTLLNAYLKLTGGTITDPDSVGNSFTQDSITGEYTNGVIKFSINYSEYNFTQTLNDEKLSIVTDLTVSSADSTKTVVLTGLKISSLDATELAALDTTGNCYNSDSVTINQAENLFIKNNIQFNVVQGVDLLLDANGDQYADVNGDMAWFNTWQNTSGVALSTNGLINDATTLTTEDSSASAEFIFASAGGGDPETKARSYTYVLRLAWTEDGVEHHAHIPVTFNISDARDLRSTYYSYMDFVNAGNDGTYTDASFRAAADVMATVNTDIVNGNGYYTQEQISAERAKLNDALLSLRVKASYTEFNNAKAQAEAILNAPADTYTDATLTAVQNALTEAARLSTDLSSSEQSVVDEATQKLLEAVNGAQTKADYSDFDAAKDALEEIANNTDGKYTDETVQNAQNALDEANKVDTDLPADENGVNQGIIDNATQNMQDVIASAKEKADYTDYNNAKTEADNLVNDDGNGNPIYDEDAFNAYKEAVENVDSALDKDLSTDDQYVIDNATQDLVNAKSDLENNKYADYTEFDAAKDALEDIVNAPAGTYTDETVQNAQTALDNANTIPENMVVGENNANQDIIDNATQNMQDVIDSATKRADYSEYNEEWALTEDVLNNYGSEGYEYDDNAFVEFEELVYILDSELDRNLPESEQATVDAYAQALRDARDALEASKYADYSALEEAIEKAEDIFNAPDGTYTDESLKAIDEAYNAAMEIPAGLLVGENNVNQTMIDNAAAALEEAVSNVKPKADYSDFENLYVQVEIIVADGQGEYTDSSYQAAVDALAAADQLDKDLTADDQATVDAVIEALRNAVNGAEYKADYSGYDNAKTEADAIVNDDGNGNPIYDEDAFNAYKEAVENVDTALNKDLPYSEQATVDEAAQALEDAKATLENNKLADYTDFNAAKDALEEIVNNPGNYTSETVENAQTALDSANQIPDGLVVGENNANQDIIDNAAADMNQVLANAQEKADYTEYDNAKMEADGIVNDDGNGNPIYDEDAFNAYKEAIENVDAALDKDLPASQQTVIDEATQAIENALEALEENRYYTITYYGLYDEVLGVMQFVAGDQFMSIDGPDLPADTDKIAYMGWLYPDGTIVNYQDELGAGDIGVYVAYEDKALNIIEDAGLAIHTSTGYITSEGRSMTVAEFLAKFDNDANLIEVRDCNGNVLGLDAYIGTGATITLNSKYSDAVYETRTVVIYGDVTGDGHVNADDYAVAKTANIIPGTYTADNYYFFVANDVTPDGYIDALDSAYINLMVKGYR